MGKTRTKSKDWLLGYGNETSLAVGTRLPLQRAVLKRFRWLRQEQVSNKPNRDIFRMILVELKEIWQFQRNQIKIVWICF